MSQKTIAKNLKKALLDDGPMAWALFEYELEEHLEEYLQSKRADGDKYFFAVTEHTHDVAMLLIDEDDHIHINEDARTWLQQLWGDVYRENIRKLIPREVDSNLPGILEEIARQCGVLPPSNSPLWGESQQSPPSGEI